ncbi:4623_t:CDS:1, partial [Rhizophagus irregularis]
MSLKQQFYQDSSRVSTKAGSSRGSDNTFDNVTQTPIAGRLIVTIVEGQKLNVSNYQSRPYCVCEFERNEV